MAAANLDFLDIEQGGTYAFQIKIIKDGTALPLDEIKFIGVIKDSIYDTEGYPYRFELIDKYTVNGYLDASVSSLIDFTKGVHEIKYINSEDFNVPLFKGVVQIALGAADETNYS